MSNSMTSVLSVCVADALSSSLLSPAAASDDVALRSTHYGAVPPSDSNASSYVRRSPEVPLPTNQQYKRANHTPEVSQVR